MVIIDTRNKGFNLVFNKPYKAEIMRYLLSSDIEANVRDIHEMLIIEGYNISRTSVIFFLQDMEADGWLSSNPRSGKGGMHNVYVSVMDDETFWRTIYNAVTESVIDASGIEDLS